MDRSVVTCNASSIAGIENFGDQLLADIYGSWISAFDPSLSVHHLAVDGIRPLGDRARTMIEKASFVLFTGGGYFSDGDVGPRRPLRKHLRALRNRNVYWRVFRQARKGGAQTAVFGVEVGPLANPLYRRAVRSILLASRPVVVRNGESFDNAKALCGKQIDIDVQLDAALTVSSKAPQKPSRDPSGEKAPANGKELRIGVHLHSIDGSESLGKFITHIASMVPNEQRVRLVFLHDQRKRGEHPAQSSKAERFLLGAFPETSVIPYLGPTQTVEAIDGLDLLITSKLHVGIVARALGVPVIALGRHPKIRRFYQSIQEEWSLGSTEGFVRGGLPAKIERYLRGGAGVRIPVGDQFKQSAWRNEELVKRLVSPGHDS